MSKSKKLIAQNNISDFDSWDKVNDAFQKYDYDGILDIIDRIEK